MNGLSTVDTNDVVWKGTATVHESFDEVYNQYFSAVYRFMRYRVDNAEIAEELTSCLFEKVLRGLSTYRPGKIPFSVWLFRIARNVINDYYRQKKRRVLLCMDSLPEMVSNDAEPAERVMEEETLMELNKAIQRLGQREQEVLALKFAGRFTNREIARTMRLSENHVGVIIYRSIHRLQTELKGGELHG